MTAIKTTITWECGICTYENVSTNTLCEMCGAHKPQNDNQSRCTICTYKSNAPKCPMCDKNKTAHKPSNHSNKISEIQSDKPLSKYKKHSHGTHVINLRYTKNNKSINHTNKMNNNTLKFKIYDIVLYKNQYAEIMCINNGNNTIGITYPTTAYIIRRHKATVKPNQIIKAWNWQYKGTWKWKDNNKIWKDYEPIICQQIDNEIKYRWYNNTNDCTFSFPLTKGKYFSQKQNKGIYMCHIHLNPQRNKLISCVQQNTKTKFLREITCNWAKITANPTRKTNNLCTKTNSFSENKELENDDKFTPNMTYKQAKCLRLGDKIDFRSLGGISFTASICDMKMEEKNEKMYKMKSKLSKHTCIKVHVDLSDSKYDKWIDIDKIFAHKLYKLQIYKSITNRKNNRFKNRLKKLQIGSLIHINPIHIDPGWKPAKIKKIYGGQVQVKFKHSVSKSDQLYWLHLDNEIECEEFGKGKMDVMHIKALFYATILPNAFRIIEIQKIANNDTVNVYESLLKTKCKNGRHKWEIEKYLWHGTGGMDSLKSIVKNGFDRSYNKVGKFGKGSYFARDASYSVRNGYCGKDKNDNYFILLCRVIVGEYTIGNKDMKQIPKKRDGTEYDSLVNNLYDPAIFVSWRDFMAVPIYLIKFKCLL